MAIVGSGQDDNSKQQAFLRFVVDGDPKASIVLGLAPEVRRKLESFQDPGVFHAAISAALAPLIREHWEKMKLKEKACSSDETSSI